MGSWGIKENREKIRLYDKLVLVCARYFPSVIPISHFGIEDGTESEWQDFLWNHQNHYEIHYIQSFSDC